MGSKASQGHHLLGGSCVAHGVALAFNPTQQLLGLVGPCTQRRAKQFVVTELSARHGGCVHRRFQQGVELLMAQRIWNKGIRVDA